MLLLFTRWNDPHMAKRVQQQSSLPIANEHRAVLLTTLPNSALTFSTEMGNYDPQKTAAAAFLLLLWNPLLPDPQAWGASRPEEPDSARNLTLPERLE